MGSGGIEKLAGERRRAGAALALGAASPPPLGASAPHAPIDVTDFIMSVVAATCATRATRPRVENATTCATPPCSRNVSAMDTRLPALPADWNVATSTSIGIVTSAEMEPPARGGAGRRGEGSHG